MLNKQTLWFLTLFSLVLVLGVYYITMPNDLLKNKDTVKTVNSDIEVNVQESDMLVALRVERDEKISDEMKELQDILISANSTSEEKNNAFEELKLLNMTKGKEQELEEKILTEFKVKSFVEINSDQIKIVINSKEHNATLANNIMRSVQSQYKEKMYITVKFESE
jgi:stage III sporulation protein AH